MSIRVPLSRSIYPRQCVEEAAAAYSSICSVEITRENAHMLEVEITDITWQHEQSDKTRAPHEFLNYLLDLSLEYHLQAA